MGGGRAGGGEEIQRVRVIADGTLEKKQRERLEERNMRKSQQGGEHSAGDGGGVARKVRGVVCGTESG